MFDTVGSVGMPEELCLSSEKLKNIFGFPDKHLGHHVERAYQALALNETRKDFVSSLLMAFCVSLNIAAPRIVRSSSKPLLVERGDKS